MLTEFLIPVKTEGSTVELATERPVVLVLAGVRVVVGDVEVTVDFEVVVVVAVVAVAAVVAVFVAVKADSVLL